MRFKRAQSLGPNRPASFQEALLELVERLRVLLDEVKHVARKEGFRRRRPTGVVDDLEELFGEVLRPELGERFARRFDSLLKLGSVGGFHDIFPLCTYVCGPSDEQPFYKS
jgi:hypothetical protein